MIFKSLYIYLAVALVFLSFDAHALDPNEILDNPVLEKRARHISKNLRCVVCQNQSIDDSDAELARDFRVLVRQRLMLGDSDQEVLDYIVSRYGDFVLLRPPVKGVTMVLWLGPIIFIIIGLGVLLFHFRRNKHSLREEDS
ncbi:MAG: cytochrome c-type biogenesis protein [Pseudomonadota bacterium]|nr:cytochrome c-type biogenesis protein [Pseudomonadota bacterium]